MHGSLPWAWEKPVLGIETSCDETASSVVAGGRILSNVIHSQTEHSLYGGVVPELASRDHVRKIMPVICQALDLSDLALEGLGGIAVTRGPGLVGCLLVGLSAGKGLALGAGLPLIGVHHVEGHLLAGLLENSDLRPPFMALVASGGHTELVYVAGLGDYAIWGRSLDDAAGEAFDKVAKLLGLLRDGETTMGGPRLSEAAEPGDPTAIDFPRGLMNSNGFDFSFSGLKTAVLYHLERLSDAQREAECSDVAASFQAAVVEVLVYKTVRAATSAGVNQVVLTGGVAANRCLRASMEEAGARAGISVFCPSPALCTDNAAMIAAVGASRLARGEQSGLDLNADPRLKLPGARLRST
ncbi:MAG: tRNA (adenosine(37)-N6)-threonylcarbamoyltransferase complex transferase subunit TsaD [Candidatus Latescibacteria bacterium]|nr:tRNA (adenosine(37)-N6)-threonylcarbamoyltransferase complex transferase subunit TsaD [Candidatus Latescibacterota bacterium]